VKERGRAVSCLVLCIPFRVARNEHRRVAVLGIGPTDIRVVTDETRTEQVKAFAKVSSRVTVVRAVQAGRGFGYQSTVRALQSTWPCGAGILRFAGWYWAL
jgi:hypothetical protein